MVAVARTSVLERLRVPVGSRPKPVGGSKISANPRATSAVFCGHVNRDCALKDINKNSLWAPDNGHHLVVWALAVGLEDTTECAAKALARIGIQMALLCAEVAVGRR